MITENSMSLPLIVQNKITAHLFYSYPLCLIINDPMLTSWYVENFIEISGFLEESHYVVLYEDIIQGNNLEKYNEVLEVSHLRIDHAGDKDSIIEFILMGLSKKLYMVINCIDRFFISNHPSYTKYHDTREIMFYGYDMQNKKLLAVDIDNSKGMVKLEYSFDEIAKAYSPDEKVTWDICMMKKPFVNPYLLNIDVLKQHILNYLLGKSGNKCFDLNLQCASHLSGTESHGICVYDYIIQNKKSFLAREIKLRYQMFHFLYQHKNTMFEKIKYVCNEYRISKNGMILQEYMQIVDLSNRMRMHVLKKNIASSNGSNIFSYNNPEIKIFNDLKQIRDMEYHILNDFIKFI